MYTGNECQNAVPHIVTIIFLNCVKLVLKERARELIKFVTVRHKLCKVKFRVDPNK